MKFELVFACIFSAVFVSAQYQEAHHAQPGQPGYQPQPGHPGYGAEVPPPVAAPVVPPPIAPFIPPVPFFNPLLLNPFLLFGLGRGRGGRRGGHGGYGGSGRRGYRSVVDGQEENQVNGQEMVEKALAQLSQKSVERQMTVCSVSSVDKVLRCEGSDLKLECRVRPQVSQMGSTRVRLEDLVLRSADDLIELVGRKSEITTTISDKDYLITLFNGAGAQNAELIGFEIEDSTCWSLVRQLVKEIKPEQHRVNLLIE
jgi:hypothetical protein